MESDSYGVVITMEIGVESNIRNITRYSKGRGGCSKAQRKSHARDIHMQRQRMMKRYTRYKE